MGKTVTLNIERFRRGYEKYLKVIEEQKKDILAKAAGNYAQWASLYVPPKPLGQKTIKEELYQRKLLYLPKEVKRERNKDQAKDIEMLKNGYRFKIYKKIPMSRKFKPMYFKKLTGQVKKWLKIENRGLLRVSFGAGITVLGEKIPTNIRRLLTKAKNLKKLVQFNKYEFHEQDLKTSLKVINDSYDAKQGGFANIAVKEGDKHAEQYITRRAKQIQKQVIKI